LSGNGSGYILSNIRVTYSGLIAFAVSIAGLVTGTFFVVIVTRQLEPEEFGIWTLISSMVYYVGIIEPLISYWTTRQIVRGEQIGKTAFFTGSIFSIGGFTVYSVVAIFVSASLGASFEVLILASVLIPLNMISGVVSSISAGYKPQITSYGVITFEVSKLPLGFIFVYIAQWGIVGALLTIIFASSLRTILLVIMTREMIVGAIKFSTIKFWLKMSWLIAYQNISGIVFRLDVMLISFATTSFTSLAFWGAAQTIGYMVIHSGQIAQALYPKLLAAGKKEIAEDSLKKTIFFALPILAASIVFAKSGLNILNPQFVDAVYAVYFIALAAFSNTIRGVFYSILYGYETVDISKLASFKEYVKSKLFFIPTLDYVWTGSYVAILAFFLIFLKTPEMSEIFIVTVWSSILLAVSIPTTLYVIILVIRQHKISIPYLSITKFLGAAFLASIIVFLISEEIVTYHESIFDFLPEILPIILLGGIIYLGITYAIDDSTRKLIKLILTEFSRKKNV